MKVLGIIKSEIYYLYTLKTLEIIMETKYFLFSTNILTYKQKIVK